MTAGRPQEPAGGGPLLQGILQAFRRDDPRLASVAWSPAPFWG
jgi:hypothetical protein